jgi:OOP family OmpA-OmpF porin
MTLALALAVPAGVSAQESGPYLGGAIGQTRFTEWCDAGTTICDDRDSGWKLFGGYRFNRYFALEGSYIDWGEVTATVPLPAGPPAHVAASQKSYGIAAVGSLQLGPQFSVFGKLGILSTEQETRRVSPSPRTIQRDESELHYGVGAAYSLSSNWALRGEWENTEKLKVQMLSIGVEYRF